MQGYLQHLLLFLIIKILYNLRESGKIERTVTVNTEMYFVWLTEEITIGGVEKFVNLIEKHIKDLAQQLYLKNDVIIGVFCEFYNYRTKYISLNEMLSDNYFWIHLTRSYSIPLLLLCIYYFRFSSFSIHCLFVYLFFCIARLNCTLRRK